MSQQRLQHLLDKLLSSDCTAAEKRELFQLIETVEEDPQLLEVLEGAWIRYTQPTHEVNDAQTAALLKNILGESRVVPLHRKRKRWPYVAVAASLVLLIGFGVYRLLLPARTGPVQPNKAAIGQDVQAPDKSKATLTLAGGKEILLDKAHSGTLATEKGMRVVMQQDGQLVIESTGAGNVPSAYNVLNNPRGSRVVTLTLPDGTRIWVNAGSTLTYPSAFSAGERKISLTGEAYFEVKHLAASGTTGVPFVVQLNGPTGNRGEVRVVGTHFNVKTYEDEADAKVTLLEGSVKVGSRQQAAGRAESVLLKPGEQAVLAESHSLLTIDHSPNLQQVVAWKNGLFDYTRSNIGEVLRDVARWYDIEIVYAGQRPDDTFTGGIDRTATLKELLTILQMTGMRYTLEGKKLTVLSSK